MTQHRRVAYSISKCSSKTPSWDIVQLIFIATILQFDGVAAQGCTKYTIRAGDTLSGIAARQSVKLSDLLALNKQIVNPDLIQIGQVLNIKCSSSTARCSTYTVKAGDTLFNIAQKSGVTLASVQALNPGIDPNKIFPGQIINIKCQTPTAGVSKYLSEAQYHALFPKRGTSPCQGGAYSYAAFMAAAKSFPKFATSANDTTNKRELAAFLAQISHETTGGSASGPFIWGLCWLREGAQTGKLPANNYCDASSTQYPCSPGKQYYGRGPIQLSWNYNYGQCSRALFGSTSTLLNNPDLVLSDATVAFRTALWFWMTPQPPLPSCHSTMTGAAPNFGRVTNIINGALECGKGFSTAAEKDRIAYYKRYCDALGVGYGLNLSCATQPPLG